MWDTPEDFMKKYGPNEAPEKWMQLMKLFSIYEKIGILYKEDVFDIEILWDMMGGFIIRAWEKFESFADYYRVNYEGGVKGQLWEYFEDLAYALMEIREIDRKNYSQRYQQRKQTRAKYGKTIPEYNP
jgi:hypothetical protein